MRKQTIAAMFSIAFATMACAGEDQNQAHMATAADAVTTGIGLATPGLGEANPLGLLTFPIRAAIVEHAKTLPREQGQPIMDSVSATGWGAAANNLLVLAGAGPVAPVIGLAVGYAMWKKGEPEREFWTACATHKKLDANTKCEFRAWTNDEVIRGAQQVYEQKQMQAAAQGAIKVSASAGAGDKLQRAPVSSNC